MENLDTVVEKLMVKVSEFKKEAHSAGLEKVLRLGCACFVG